MAILASLILFFSTGKKTAESDRSIALAERGSVLEREQDMLRETLAVLSRSALSAIDSARQGNDAEEACIALSRLETSAGKAEVQALLEGIRAIPIAALPSPGTADAREALSESSTLLPFARAVLAAVPKKTETATFVVLEKFVAVRSVSSKAASLALKAQQSISGGADSIPLGDRAGMTREAIARERGAVGEIALQNRKNAKELRAMSAEIQSGIDLLGSIEEIAQRSQLIAFNLAIEAAHFGSKGGGFKVIAGELRSLNDRTSDFSKRVTELLQHFNNYNSLLVNEMAVESERLVGEVEQGMKVSEQSVESLIDSASSTDTFARDISALAIEIDRDMDGVLESLQFQDITRQMIEGAIFSMDELGKSLKKGEDYFSPPAARDKDRDHERTESIRQRLIQRAKTIDEKDSILEVDA